MNQLSGCRDRHDIRPGVLVHLPVPRSLDGWSHCLALRWRYRTLVAFLAIALIPVLLFRTLPAACVSLGLVGAVLNWDCFARRCFQWSRYAGEHALLQKLLSKESVEAFYAASRDEMACADPLQKATGFGEHPAAEVDAVHFLRYLWLRRLQEVFLRPSGVRVLDLGCHHGLMTPMFDRPGDSLVAVDLNPEALRIVRRFHQRWRLARVDARALPFRSNQFDFINFSEVVEHLSDPRSALAEIKRCLRPGGLFFLTTNNRHGLLWSEWINPFCVLERVIGLALPSVLPPPNLLWKDEASGLVFYHTNFSSQEIQDLIQRAGLEIIMQRSYYHVGELQQGMLKVFPHWTERQMAGLLYGVDRFLTALPVVRHMGMQWLIVGKRPTLPGAEGPQGFIQNDPDAARSGT